MNKFLFLVLISLLTSCTNKLDGTYTDSSGLLKYTFKPNGKVYQSAMGIELEMPYTIEGDLIKLPVYQGVSIVLTLRGDGALISPMGVLRKQDSDKKINLPKS